MVLAPINTNTRRSQWIRSVVNPKEYWLYQMLLYWRLCWSVNWRRIICFIWRGHQINLSVFWIQLLRCAEIVDLFIFLDSRIGGNVSTLFVSSSQWKSSTDKVLIRIMLRLIWSPSVSLLVPSIFHPTHHRLASNIRIPPRLWAQNAFCTQR